LESLRAFDTGAGEAPFVTKWTNVLEAAAGNAQAGQVGLNVETNGNDQQAQAITFVLSTDDVDRHGDVISTDGWVLDSYRENPVLLWAHDYRRPAIGKAVKLWAEPHRLLADMDFAPTEFAQEIACLYRSGFQWGVSVGFKPLRYEERRDEKTGAFLGLRFLEQELLEVSAVPVPANRRALRRSNNSGQHVGIQAKYQAEYQADNHALDALWPVLASQVDELGKIAAEIASTVDELENLAKSLEQPARIADIVAALRTAKG
jgi:HK97 family phage prohead protease